MPLWPTFGVYRRMYIAVGLWRPGYRPMDLHIYIFASTYTSRGAWILAHDDYVHIYIHALIHWPISMLLWPTFSVHRRMYIAMGPPCPGYIPMDLHIHIYLHLYTRPEGHGYWPMTSICIYIYIHESIGQYPCPSGLLPVDIYWCICIYTDVYIYIGVYIYKLVYICIYIYWCIYI